MLTLRANLNLRSESFRHAIRLAVALAVASVLVTQLPLERGYWVALTTLVVLRPDYRGTMSRGIERILGTLVGSVVATVIAAQLRPGPWTLVVLVGVFAFLSVATLRASYPIFAAFLTCYVVFLISLTGLPSSTAGLDRLIDTAVGGPARDARLPAVADVGEHPHRSHARAPCWSPRAVTAPRC